MRKRLQPWHLAVLVTLLGVVALAVARWYPELQTYDAARMTSILPADPSTAVLYIDAGALRKAGVLDLLAGSKAVEEPDYRQFVEQTGFDYRSDLDGIAAAFFPQGAFFAVRGRFQWKRLNAYAAAQGGQCRGSVCSMPGSRPERIISFYPLQSNLLALAVAPQSSAVMQIGPAQVKTAPTPGGDPVWLSVPPATFANAEFVPAGMRAFVRPLEQASKITFAAGPSVANKDKNIELRMEVTCATPQAATDLARQLTETTALLKNLIAREGAAPNPRDLSGVLTAGNFQQQQSRVIGIWPIERAFMEALASGQVR